MAIPNYTKIDKFRNTKSYGNLPKVTTGEVVRAKTFTDLINAITNEWNWRQSIDYTTYDKKGTGATVLNYTMTAVDVNNLQTGMLIKASDISAMIDEMNKIGVSGLICDCNCNYCSCNCNYCTCNCNYCTCNCNYCTCNCNWLNCYHSSKYINKRNRKWI